MIYVPILKYKKGEKDALYNLKEDDKKNVLPLIEVTPDTISKGSFDGVCSFWENKQYILDISPEYYDHISDDEFNQLIKHCNKKYVIPCLNLSYSDERVSDLVNDYNSIAIRLFIEQILDDDFENDLNDFLSAIDTHNVDLIIDLQFVDPNKLNELSFLIRGIVDTVSNLASFRRVILASNSFPDSLRVEKYQLTLIPRIESKIFKKSKPYFQNKNIDIIYSDYAVNHWSYFEFIPGMQPSFNIRYTYDDVYVIYKGDTIKKGGLNFDKVKAGCDLLVSSIYYKNKEFSWGDNEIYTKHTNSTTRPGSLTTWRSIGTSHHISFILNSLANQSVS